MPLIRSVGKFGLVASVASHIDIISGISDFPPVKKGEEAAPHDDWSYRPSGGDSTLSVSLNYPNSLEAPQTFGLMVAQDLANQSFTFSASQVPSVKGDNSVVYTLNANGLVNQDANVTVTVTTVSGTGTKKPYQSAVSIAPWITPEITRTLYNIPVGLNSVHPNNSQVLFLLKIIYFIILDHTTFYYITILLFPHSHLPLPGRCRVR